MRGLSPRPRRFVSSWLPRIVAVWGLCLGLSGEPAAGPVPPPSGEAEQGTVQARPSQRKPAERRSERWGFLTGLLLTLVAAQYFFRLSKAPPESPRRE